MKLSQEKLSFRAHLPRTGFDMSYTSKFTSSVGHILPVLYDFLLAGDEVKIKEDMFTRTQTLHTSAFVDIKEHIEYFFVPMTQIFALYPQWKYSVGNPVSNMFDAQSVHPTLPFFHTNDIAQLMYDISLPDSRAGPKR